MVPAAEEAARERPAAVPEQARKPQAEHQEREPRGLRQLLVRRRKLARKFKVIYLNLNEPFLETSVTGLGAFLKFLVTNFPTKVAQICGERFGLF